MLQHKLNPSAVDSLLERATTPPQCSNEEAFRARWRTVAKKRNSPLELAIEGGLLADRMAWVFVSGYQAAIRACFGLSYFEEHNDTDWLCVAVSEPQFDLADAKRTAGVEAKSTDENTYLLEGNKSWIAASGSINALIVKAGRGSKAQCFYVRANTAGLKISTKSSAKLLPELSQGRAIFCNAEIASSKEIDKRKLTEFSLLEIYYIFVAISASIYAKNICNSGNVDHAGTSKEPLPKINSRQTDLLDRAGNAVRALSQLNEIDHNHLKPLADNVVSLLTEIRADDPNSFHEQDQKLLEMYASMLKK